MNDSYLERLCQQTITAPELISLLAGYQMLPQLYRELLIDQAIASIECTPEEIEQAKQEDSQQIETLATRKLRLEKFKLATWGHKVESYFLTQKAQLDQVTYSLLRTRDMALAQELYFRIKAKEQSFAEIARQYSQGPEAQTGGLIGPTPLTQPHPQLVAKLRASQPGQLLPPTRLGEWIVIVRLEQIVHAKLDESTRKKLLNKLFQEWLQESLQATLNKTLCTSA
ncbi:peptidylprolyl isomerase [Nostoc parmelioides]|uniref:peptidylprolyl isomerase n=1 Tax=Nostoc parmelioides FACHB-3921 TaxID=2692909 RepID=A0ABR8BIR0_9NOSO|nr:peptidylprolyl isomerase [Nostoc parmelioides]MBD2252775.1 peptidylprolyl isomerase [Nostoc parmelioides FACHB-3921]